jgi:AcrR family transcriptional regulator
MTTTKPAPTGRRRNAPRKGDLRELAILDAAEKLLERDGFEPITVEQIAKGAGITRGALYFYFGSKQEVLTALVARTMEVIVEAATIAGDDVDSPPADTIRRAMKRTEQQWRDHRVVMCAAVDYAPFIPDINALWRGTVETYIASTAKVLVRAGLPDDDSPTGATKTAHALCWMTERNYYIAVTQAPPKPDLGDVSETSLGLWLRSIAPR